MKLYLFLLGLIILSACTSVAPSDTKYFEEEDQTVLSQKYDLSHLTQEQYAVTQLGATEPPFQNEYWDNHEDGIYVSVVSGEALFSSTDKYDSGTGWPSFTRSIADIEREMDTSQGMIRTEIKAQDGSHLGHVFDDGPPEEGGARYCVNSASIRFIPLAEMKEQGYGDYLYLFDGS
ncbi:MAG: peptide-methionine (R)-S-oxide reductase MsrB [Nanoarchaeota archaeon]|nr:peptide-methionine (R)-S-oxide reductase MsrB [Nanoarchaeota archaeon]